ncbi:hypothetical protein BJY16_004092 [Actinoplanes octamycinicus]|uniref:Uncharacterized protein n=1 Tax=Actinoplanes octamycinicus TaxID=135948 RepID=A0A7W7GYH3_9ACTN|nr:hypothetical protein [Actinoplanes octamycinicus]MBB4740633.1 hypothetical protein [Actinoplanes octamycinicus]GIE63064.1 hypothetical protein Aoc01nite_84660 [Actinoplanes octamycinicus]
MKRCGWFLLGGGLGVLVGAELEGPMLVPGLVTAGVGLVLLVFAARSGGAELVGDAMAAPAAAREDRPSLAHLGSRVETILGMAEQQAADTIAEAEKEAGRIVARARAEADRARPQGL